MTPKRIQRKRTKGWRKPEGAVYVGRGTKWGNPWKVSPMQPHADAVAYFRNALDHQWAGVWDNPDHENWIRLPSHDEIRAELAGKDLMCWCPLDQACHADVLLELANGDDQ